MKQLFGEPVQSACRDIWAMKYQLHDKDENPVDTTPEDSRTRVADALASVEDDPDHWYPQFVWAMDNGAIPAGRIYSNLGATEHKPGVSAINCVVSGTIEDSIEGIFKAVSEGATTLAAGCGIGYEFSTLRPYGAYVGGAGAKTSGPLPFMDVFDRMCFTISSAGGRRGAQMATFDVSHPDIRSFIKAKREDGRLRQFNLSCLITKSFMDAVAADGEWLLCFPMRESDAEASHVVWRSYPHMDAVTGYIVDPAGLYKCKVYERARAKELYDLIMRSTYDYSEPGFLLIDTINDMNNLWFAEQVRASNPCGEQMLGPYHCCLLGSIDLTHFILDPFTEKAQIDYEKFHKVVRLFTRMLDNVVDQNGLPLERQRDALTSTRRHGMGYTGLGSALTMLGLTYGSEAAVRVTEEITKELARINLLTGMDLADEKGMAPLLEQAFHATPAMKNRCLEVSGNAPLTTTTGAQLMAYGSKYLPQVLSKKELRRFAQGGCRFTHATSIAPTGTISFGLCNNVSGGIEPSFSHSYLRNIIVAGSNTKKQEEVQSYEFLLYKHLIDPEATPETLPAYFTTADSVHPREHIAIQAAAQKYVDTSISKTTNVATDFPFEEFADLYQLAYASGLKGCTTFRMSEAFTGVLVNKDDLDKMQIEFTLQDGTTVSCKGSDTIEYDGEEHNAGNLRDAIKEGTYGAHR